MDKENREELSVKVLKFTINVAPVTKKNSQGIIYNPATKKRMIVPSKAYKQFERDCFWFMPKCEPIDYPVNVQCTYYMKTHRRVDLSNLINATLDVLVKYGVLKDDNSEIVASLDGCGVLYDQQRPRTEVLITEIKEG